MTLDKTYATSRWAFFLRTNRCKIQEEFKVKTGTTHVALWLKLYFDIHTFRKNTEMIKCLQDQEKPNGHLKNRYMKLYRENFENVTFWKRSA